MNVDQIAPVKTKDAALAAFEVAIFEMRAARTAATAALKEAEEAAVRRSEALERVRLAENKLHVAQDDYIVAISGPFERHPWERGS